MVYSCPSTLQSEGFSDLELVGSGPHGRVYSAHDGRMDYRIAVKKIEIRQNVCQRRIREDIAAVKKAKHRNIAPIFYAIVRPHSALIVMPLKQGDLRSIMPIHYDMNDKTSVFYSLTIQMLSVLTYLQEEGICHQAIKPSNILVDTQQQGYGFYLTDFDLTSNTNDGEIRTVAYFYKAPETYMPIFPVTTKQDVWSLFVTLAVACGQISEVEMCRKSSGYAGQAIEEAGARMSKLRSMAQRNPTLRAPASAVFHQLRPKETIGTGTIEFPEVSPEYFGLYGSGRLERDIAIPLGPNANVQNLTGPLGLPPLATFSVVFPHSVASLPPPSSLNLNIMDRFMLEQAASTRNAIPRASASSSYALTHQPQYEQARHGQQVESSQASYRCMHSCCHILRPVHVEPVRQPQYSLFGNSHHRSFNSVAPGLYSANPPVTLLEESFDIWGVPDAGAMGHIYDTNTNNKVFGSYSFGLQGTGYIRPYPIACDSQGWQMNRVGDLQDFVGMPPPLSPVDLNSPVTIATEDEDEDDDAELVPRSPPAFHMF
ncbi:hypothetical protein TARUN_10177 [Trichoderma arundinaceum]|uniref:Protein kinase domain-containing protein n=1 Tax=Trichoderma arundinaceum TaxID=490622 RepID=A0A395N7J2_TRIAR|nr:hypothetical protein TARUN_10177 [Trichoderma arundinaceum]